MLILTLGGDYYDDTFNMYSADLSFKNFNFSIFLSAEPLKILKKHESSSRSRKNK